MKFTKQCIVEYNAPSSPQPNGDHELTHWGYKAKAMFYKSKLFIITQVFGEFIFCMNRFLPYLSERIRHRRCEQRHTNLWNVRWFLSCVYCFHCLIILIFFQNVTTNLFNEKKNWFASCLQYLMNLAPSSPLVLSGNYLFKPHHTFLLTEQSSHCISLLGKSSGACDRSYWQALPQPLPASSGFVRLKEGKCHLPSDRFSGFLNPMTE